MTAQDARKGNRKDVRDGGTVKALWRYPVKSMAGAGLEDAPIDEGGISGDRAYAVIDRTSGRVGSAKHPKKWAGLIALAADFIAPPPTIWDEEGVIDTLIEMDRAMAENRRAA